MRRFVILVCVLASAAPGCSESECAAACGEGGLVVDLVPVVESAYEGELDLDGVGGTFTCVPSDVTGWAPMNPTGSAEAVLRCDGAGFTVADTPETVQLAIRTLDGILAGSSSITPAYSPDGPQCTWPCPLGATVLVQLAEPEGEVFPCTEQGIRDAIAEGGGRHTFDCNGPTTVVTEADIAIDTVVILDGESRLTIDGSFEHSVFTVGGSASADLRGFTITRGTPGILNRGRLVLRDITVSGNRSEARGGISSTGTLILESTTVSGNVATGDDDADVVGGIYGSGPTTLTNTTVSGNTATGEHAVDGLFHFRDELTLTNSTLYDQLYTVGPGTVTSTASIYVEYCLEEWPYDEVTWVSGGYNIGCGFDDPSDLGGVRADELRLGPLQDNGGPTETHALGAGSVAIDVIPAGMCEVDADQRGIDRPHGDACDVGAFEREVTP